MMPTKRTKRGPVRRADIVPEWVRHFLLTDEEPGEREPGYDQFFGWRFCGEEIPGLGRLVTEEDAARLAALRKEARRAR
jgi:hypothetical protein